MFAGRLQMVRPSLDFTYFYQEGFAIILKVLKAPSQCKFGPGMINVVKMCNYLLYHLLKSLKIICPAYQPVTEDPIFKSLFVHLCLINYWISQSCDLNRKEYSSLSNRCLS